MTVSYPTPLYSNVPINADFYKPSRYVISDITLGTTTVVTTTKDNNYTIGQLVRLLVPYAYGTYQLNEQQGYVLSLPAANKIEVDINSVFYSSYIAANTTNPPQVLAIGDINSGSLNAKGISNTSTFIPGSFINISPL